MSCARPSVAVVVGILVMTSHVLAQEPANGRRGRLDDPFVRAADDIDPARLDDEGDARPIGAYRRLEAVPRVDVRIGAADPFVSSADRYAEGVRVTRFQEELPPPVRPGDYGDDRLPPASTRAPRGFAHDLRPKSAVADYVLILDSNLKGSASSVTMHELDVAYQFRFPFGDRFMLTVRPFADVLFIVGPRSDGPLVPETLYKAAVDVQADYKFTDRLGGSVAITPGIWTDFRAVDGDDFRLPARILATFHAGEGLFIAGGFLYTDNIRRNLLPVIGVIWDINEKFRLELLYPRSRVVFRANERFQFYAALERGGDTWNIRQLPGVDENFEYRDLRLLFGTQFDVYSYSAFVELGYVTNRKFRFEVQTDPNIDSSFLVRAGVRF